MKRFPFDVHRINRTSVLFALFALAASLLQAQNSPLQVTSSSTPGIYRISIGHIQPNGYTPHGYGSTYLGFNVYQSANNTWNYGTDGGSNGSSMVWSSVTGELRFSAWDNAGSTAGTLSDATMLGYTRMRIQNNGQVIIGAPATSVNSGSLYKLYVEGGIRTEEVQVDLKANWPDYVFADDYQLPTLPALGAYLRVHKHLPGFAPASEIQANGIAVSETIRLQQEKIEELYLYLIALEKRIAELENNQ